MRPGRVAVLGAGIMGASVALLLARRGVAVTLFDRAEAPFAGASRWNEGKIHLGHLYGGDPSLATARRVLPGGLAFRPLVEALIGTSIGPAITREDDIYLVHRDSVAGPEAMARYFEAVTALAVAHPAHRDYLADLAGARCRGLSRAELEGCADTSRIIAGFRVPERSVATTWIADRFLDALSAEPRIAQAMRTEILGVAAPEGEAGPLMLRTSRGTEGPFDVVVNALWQERLLRDRDLGLAPPAERSHRFRLSVFLRTRREMAAPPSAVVAVGPFGDVKNYDGRNFYLSWYPAGLLAEGSEVAPPPCPALTDARRAEVGAAILDTLGGLLPPVARLAAEAEALRVEGGWVYASGQGSLADPGATLHRRDRIGLRRRGNYLSVDTGKYSVAPWLAEEIARLLTEG